MTTTNNPTANPNLTDAECDAILRRLHGDVRLDRTAINTVDWALYRKSQYVNFDEAVRHGAIAEMCDVFGYTSAVDSLLAMEQTANLLDYRSAADDVRIIITINNVHLPECALADASTEIHRHMVRQGWYTITPSN